jgi:hypothetical protein
MTRTSVWGETISSAPARRAAAASFELRTVPAATVTSPAKREAMLEISARASGVVRVISTMRMPLRAYASATATAASAEFSRTTPTMACSTTLARSSFLDIA